MARRKSKFDPVLSADKYISKVTPVWIGVGATPDLAQKITKALADKLIAEGGKWSKVRRTVLAVCKERGVPKFSIGMYMSAVQLYLKDVIDREIDPDVSLNFIQHAYPLLDINILLDCIRAITGEEIFPVVPLPKKKEGKPIT